MAHHHDRAEYLAISYPTLDEWTSKYDLQLTEVTTALADVLRATYGERPGLLEARCRRHYFDVRRLINVLEQLDLLRERDVFSLSFRCPTRLGRYHQALGEMLLQAEEHGVQDRRIAIVHCVHDAVAIFQVEVTAFYRGLS